jgi:peptide/nickel transport system permease protein
MAGSQTTDEVQSGPIPDDVHYGPPRRRTSSGLVLFVVRRIAQGVITLAILSVLIFLATNALPGDAAEAALGKDATPARLAELRSELGLDKNIAVQYGTWVIDAVHGDLGKSTLAVAQGSSDPSVTHLIAAPLRNTLILWGIVAILLVPTTLIFGTIAARYEGRFVDHALSYGGLFLGSMPEFVLGTVLIFIFFTTLRWLDPVALFDVNSNPLDHLGSLVLPVMTLLGVSGAFATRQVRAGVREALHSDHVTAARLNGLPSTMVLRRYGLRAAIAPSIQTIAQSLQLLFSGLIVVEALFAFPGIGQTLVTSVQSQDVSVVQSIALLLAAIFLLINIVADLLVVLLVPTLRTAVQ